MGWRGRLLTLMITCPLIGAPAHAESTLSSAEAKVDKGFHDTGHAITKGAHAAGHAITNGAHAVGHAFERGAQRIHHAFAGGTTHKPAVDGGRRVPAPPKLPPAEQ